MLFKVLFADELRESYDSTISHFSDTAHVLSETSRMEYNTVDSCKSDDISDIARTLRSIFNGKYDPED